MVFVAFDWQAARAAVMAARTAGSVRLGMVGGVVEGTLDDWMQEVKRSAAREHSGCGLFPPSRYFHS